MEHTLACCEDERPTSSDSPMSPKTSIRRKVTQRPSFLRMATVHLPPHIHIHDLRFKERIRHFTWTWFTMTVRGLNPLDLFLLLTGT